MYYVGLDVHQYRTSVEILDCNGKGVKRLEVRGRWPALLEELRKAPRPFAVCYEASCGYGYLYEELSKLAQRVTVAHPAALAWIYKSKKKHDRIDAIKLAKLLYLDEVPTVHVPAREIRLWRQTIEFRQKLLQMRVSAKNQIRAFLRERGLAAPKNLWSGKGLAWLRTLELDEAAGLHSELLIDALQEANQKMQRVEKYLNRVVDRQSGVALLRTIPGIGRRSAEALMAYIDDVQRFGSIKEVGSYFGLIPCQDASADKNHLGHITREGPATVRKLLCEVAWVAIRRSRTVGAYFQRVMHHDPERKKIALIATAHYLLRVAASMLRSGECWRESVELTQAATEADAPGGGENPSRPQGFSPPPNAPRLPTDRFLPSPLSPSPPPQPWAAQTTLKALHDAGGPSRQRK